MGEPSGQPKCCTKSRELLRVPMTRYLSGLCGSVTSPSWELSGVRTEHHTWGRGTAVGTGETPPPWGARKWQPGGAAEPYLREAHEEELVVGEPQRREPLLFSVLLQPGFVRLWDGRHESVGGG